MRTLILFVFMAGVFPCSSFAHCSEDLHVDFSRVKESFSVWVRASANTGGIVPSKISGMMSAGVLYISTLPEVATENKIEFTRLAIANFKTYWKTDDLAYLTLQEMLIVAAESAETDQLRLALIDEFVTDVESYDQGINSNRSFLREIRVIAKLLRRNARHLFIFDRNELEMELTQSKTAYGAHLTSTRSGDMAAQKVALLFAQYWKMANDEERAQLMSLAYPIFRYDYRHGDLLYLLQTFKNIEQVILSAPSTPASMKLLNEFYSFAKGFDHTSTLYRRFVRAFGNSPTL